MEELLLRLKSTTGYWYLASPYSKYPVELGGIHGAFHEICRCAAWMIKHGVHVYVPIIHTHPIAIYGNLDPRDHTIWMPLDEHFMKGACGIIVAQMPTWEESYGIGVEVRQFRADNKPVEYLEWPRSSMNTKDNGVIRTFDTGATRNTAEGKLDFEGFLSPLALERYAEYMHHHSKQQDGSLRDSDNWQKGIPRDALIKSAFRHFFAWWKIHRGGIEYDLVDNHEITADEAICGLLFNAMAYLHDIESKR